MGLTVGVTGSATRDHFFASSRVSRREGIYRIEAAGREFTVEMTKAGYTRKPFALFDAELLQYADSRRFGGGGYNSALAIRRTAPDIEIRYSDSGPLDSELARDLACRGIACHFREILPTPHNVVTADPEAEDKLVFKSKPPESSPRQAPPDGEQSWLGAGGTVLLNSDKDEAWVTRIASAAARGRLDLYAVLTPSLPAEYLFDVVLPSAKFVVGGLDELGETLGIPLLDSVEDGARVLRLLARRAMSPVARVTLGDRGVLVADPAEMTVLLVRLAPAKAAEVRAAAGADRSRVCGCGDCYAGAVTSYMLAGRSVFGAGPLHDSPFAAAAIAGCSAAVLKLGYEGRLSPSDFEVSEAGDLGLQEVEC